MKCSTEAFCLNILVLLKSKNQVNKPGQLRPPFYISAIFFLYLNDFLNWYFDFISVILNNALKRNVRRFSVSRKQHSDLNHVIY